jgi:hypothetical protein
MIHLIASYGHLEKLDDAVSLINRLNRTRALRSASPIYIQRIMRKLPYKLQANKLQLFAGLHKAGMKYGIQHGGKS